MRRLGFALLLVATTGYADEYKRGEIVDGMVCASDPTITYAYYLPASYTPEKRWPILYIFDPRQRGAFAAGLFRDAAEQYGWILVSSNNTRSDAAANRTHRVDLRPARFLRREAGRRPHSSPSALTDRGV